MSRPEKHSLTLRGHRTSVSLEPEFWSAFRTLARTRGLGLNTLATGIDETRGDTGLATAIRLEILRDLQERGGRTVTTRPSDPRPFILPTNTPGVKAKPRGAAPP